MQPSARDPVTVAVDRGHLVVGEDPGAALCGAARHRPDRLPDVDARVRYPEGTSDLRVQARLLAQRLRHRDLLAIDVGLAAGLGEAIGVGGVVPGCGDEQAAGVLDAVGCDPPQDAVLGDAFARQRVRP